MKNRDRVLDYSVSENSTLEVRFRLPGGNPTNGVNLEELCARFRALSLYEHDKEIEELCAKFKVLAIDGFQVQNVPLKRKGYEREEDTFVSISSKKILVAPDPSQAPTRPTPPTRPTRPTPPTRPTRPTPPPTPLTPTPTPPPKPTTTPPPPTTTTTTPPPTPPTPTPPTPTPTPPTPPTPPPTPPTPPKSTGRNQQPTTSKPSKPSKPSKSRRRHRNEKHLTKFDRYDTPDTAEAIKNPNYFTIINEKMLEKKPEKTMQAVKAWMAKLQLIENLEKTQKNEIESKTLVFINALEDSGLTLIKEEDYHSFKSFLTDDKIFIFTPQKQKNVFIKKKICKFAPYYRAEREIPKKVNK
eukprot:Pgem_evm1s3398